MPITRRKFLKDLGIGSAVVMAWQAGLLSAADIAGIEEALARGDETWVTSVCQMCPGACGIRVRKIGSWPVSVTGNPLHPINYGTLCPKGVASILSFYDPDRLRSPMKRVGERGEGKWQEISWDEAIPTVTGELKRLREGGEPHKVAVVGGRYAGLMRTLFQRFLDAYGSPNYIDNSFARWQGPVEALEKTQGVSIEPRWDLPRTRYILSFGTPLLDAGTSPVENLRGWSEMRRGTAHRGRVVQIESRLSTTAAKADEWIPVNPGTEGWLAMGIIHVLLKEDLYDGYYLGDHSEGFGSFKSAVLESYSHQKISEVTGVPVDTMIRIAREFAATKPAIAISGRIDPNDQVAIHTLNALVGSINIPGGVLIPRDLEMTTIPPVNADPVAREGVGRGKARLATGEPYPFQVAFFYYTDPLFSNPQPDRFKETIAKIPLLVSFSPFLDETASFCDLILPDHTSLERLQDVPSSTSQGYPVVGLSEPVHPPLYETRHTGDVILEIAGKLGGTVASALPWKNFESLLQDHLKTIFEAQRGDLFGSEFESNWTSFLSRGGWWFPSYSNFDEFNKLIRSKGGWWDPVYFFEDWGKVFRGESGRFRFPSLKDLPSFGPKGRDDFPLALVSYPLMALTGTRNANQPWLADIAGPQVQIGWKTWVEIHPETARKSGIKEKEEVWIESEKGRIKAVATLYEGNHPEAVGVPFGFGHTAMGRWAKGIGSNPRKIQETETGTSETPREGFTRVKVYKG